MFENEYWNFVEKITSLEISDELKIMEGEIIDRTNKRYYRLYMQD